MLRETHITTFGYDHSGPPKGVDRVYDVRGMPDYPFDDDHELEARAQEIMDELEPGDSIAIGCEHGHDRSPFIAHLIEENYPSVTVTHQDYDKLTEEKDNATSERQEQGRSKREHSRDDT